MVLVCFQDQNIKMGLFFYDIKVECDNCGYKNVLRVKRGVLVKDFVKSVDCKCKNCGCHIEPKEYTTEFIK